MPISRVLQEVRTVPLHFEMASHRLFFRDAGHRLAAQQPHAVCMRGHRKARGSGPPRAVLGKWRAKENRLAHFICPAARAVAASSIFIACRQASVEAANRIGAEVIELHTRAYCVRLMPKGIGRAQKELQKLEENVEICA